MRRTADTVATYHLLNASSINSRCNFVMMLGHVGCIKHHSEKLRGAIH